MPDDERACARRKFGEPARDRGECGFISDQEMPVEIRWNNKGASRPADVERVTGLCLGGPVRRRTGVVQCKVDLQTIRGGVITARREIAVDRVGSAGGVKRAVGQKTA